MVDRNRTSPAPRLRAHSACLPGIAALIGPGIAVLAVALVGAALGFAEAT